MASREGPQKTPGQRPEQPAPNSVFALLWAKGLPDLSYKFCDCFITCGQVHTTVNKPKLACFGLILYSAISLKYYLELHLKSSKTYIRTNRLKKNVLDYNRNEQIPNYFTIMLSLF